MRADAGEETLRGELLRTARADLFLAIACDRGVPGAWEALARRFLPGLGTLVFRLGAPPAVARAILEELPGELCSPPPRGGARTRIGTFDGSGSLAAWLAVHVRRRLVDRWRAARTCEPAGPLEELPAPEIDPGDALVAKETRARARSALESGWARMTTSEALACEWKLQGAMSQRQIAQLLGVCEPRVSRLLDAAQLKLWTAIRRGIGRSALSTIERGQIVDALSELVAERRRAAPRAS
jgi:RNA polymerase sigma factor (sigma-70 family)